MGFITALGPADAPVVALALLSLVLLVLVIFWDGFFPLSLQQRVARLRDKDLNPPAPLPDAVDRKIDTSENLIDTLYQFMRQRAGARTRDLSLRLRRAGRQDQHAVVMFMLVKLAIPLLGFPVLWLYLDVAFADSLPGAVRLALATGLAMSSFWLPDIFLHNAILRRQARIRQAWPDALVLLQLCIDAGMGLEAAISKTAQEIEAISPDIAEEFRITVAELVYFQSRGDALENLGERIGLPAVREVTLAIAQAERYGMALSATLNTLADDSRRARLAAAEKKAASLPAKLTVPMILFFLPALFVVILTPAIIQVFGIE